MKIVRQVLAVVLMLAVAASVALASSTPEQPAAGAPAAVPAASATSAAREAPELAELVKAGKLPPLEQRLPKEPLVVKPVNEVGQYGGTLRRAYLNPADAAAYTRLLYDTFLKFTTDGQTIEPNFARKYEVSPDGKVYTLYLREGVKWSDGTPFTVDDIMFQYNDVSLNKELNPSPPAVLMAGGQVGKLEKLDNYSFRISFAVPNAMFLRTLATHDIATPGTLGHFWAPAHYLKQFHPSYTPREKIDAMVKEAKMDTWSAFWASKADRWMNPELPVMHAWKLVNKPGEARLVAERNPYYWKVDTAGKQLPYISRVVHDQVQNAELILLKATNGELDFWFRTIKFEDYTLLKENEKKGNYTVYTHAGDRAADVAFWPNMSHPDPVYNQLMNSVPFKQALSLAIDRNEINTLFYNGLGTPRAITAIRSEPTYEADVARMNIKYDVAEANRILDGLGFAKKDANGIRLGPDGKPIFFTLFYATAWPIHGEVAQVVSGYWKKIGIDSLVKPMERSVFYQMSYNNEIPMVVFTSPGTSLANNWWVFPNGAHNSYAYGRWYATNGKEGIEPPAGSRIRQAMDLYRKALQSPKFEDVVAAVKQILRWANEEIWGIGTVGELPAVGVVSNKLGNVPKDAPSGTHLGHPANLFPEQWYFKP